jgi:hypothetical protein
MILRIGIYYTADIPYRFISFLNKTLGHASLAQSFVLNANHQPTVLPQCYG